MTSAQRACKRIEMEMSNSSYLSEDILVSKIFSLLPVKSCCRFKCVSKRWEQLISENLSSRDSSSTVAYVEQAPQSPSDEKLYKLIFPFEETSPLSFSSRHFRMVTSSCNGILSTSSHVNVCLINPATGEKCSISTQHRKYLIGLAFDPLKSPTHYQVVCPFNVSRNSYHSTNYKFEVFSSKTMAWSISRANVELSRHVWDLSLPIFASGALFWNAMEELLWFHPDEDLAGAVPFPDKNNHPKWISRIIIGGWQDVVTLSRIRDDEKMEVWIMSDFECMTSKYKWAKMYSFNLNDVIRKNMDLCSHEGLHRMGLRGRNSVEFILRHWDLGLRPVPYAGGKKVMWEASIGKGRFVIFSYDMKTEKLQKFEYRWKEEQYHPFVLYQRSSFSLKSIPGSEKPERPSTSNQGD